MTAMGPADASAGMARISVAPDRRSRNRSALTCCLQHRVAEERWLRSSWLLPEGAALCRNCDGAKLQRDHAAGERPVRGQGEMEPRARACLEREQADQNSFFVEQTAAARTRIERRRGAYHFAAVVWVEPFNHSVANRELASAWKACSDNAFSNLQRLRTSNCDRGQIEVGDADKTKVVRRAARLDRRSPARSAARDVDAFGFASDMASGRDQVGRDDDARSPTLRAIGSNCTDSDHTVCEVTSLQRSGQDAGDRGHNEPRQRHQRSRRTVHVNHERGHCRKHAMVLPWPGRTPGLPAKCLLDKGLWPTPTQAGPTRLHCRSAPLRTRRVRALIHGTAWGQTRPLYAGAPPPRLLFCRLLE